MKLEDKHIEEFFERRKRLMECFGMEFPKKFSQNLNTAAEAFRSEMQNLSIFMLEKQLEECSYMISDKTRDLESYLKEDNDD